MNRNEIFIQGMVFGWLLMLIAMAAGWYARTFWTWWRGNLRSTTSMPDLRFLAANEKLRRSNEELKDAIHKYGVRSGYQPKDGPKPDLPTTGSGVMPPSGGSSVKDGAK